jgi:predicted amidophosphoribosyltransferase
MAGQVSEAATTGMAGVAVARQRGADRTYGNLLLGDAVEALILVGRWDEADDLLPDEPDPVAHGTPLIATNLWLSAANLHTWRGRFDESRRFLDACMAAFTGHGHVRSMLHGNLSERCLWLGQYAEAAEWIRRELDLVGAMDFTSLLSRLVLQGLRAEAGLPRPLHLPRLVELLEDMSARPDPPPDAAALIGLCWAEVGRIRGEPDADRWESSADDWTKLEMPWPLAYVRWRQAETLLARRPSADQRRSGRRRWPRRTPSPPASAPSHCGRRWRRWPTGPDCPHWSHRRPASSPDALTTGNATCSTCCAPAPPTAASRSSCFISEKTVSIHVSRILAKLNASNRAEAAAVARRRQLVR